MSLSPANSRRHDAGTPMSRRINRLRGLLPNRQPGTDQLLSPHRMSAAIARETAHATRSGGMFVVLHLYCRSSTAARKLRRRIRQRLRLSDQIGYADDTGPLQRLGGVGLVMLLPDTSIAGAYRLAVELCKDLPERHRPTVALRQHPDAVATQTDDQPDVPAVPEAADRVIDENVTAHSAA